MIHRTSVLFVEDILSEGLKTDMRLHMTEAGSWSHVWYGKNPIFLAEPSASFLCAIRDMDSSEDVEFEVDVGGLKLVADLPSLCDIGGHVEDGVIWWKMGHEPPDLLEFLDEDGGIEIEFLVDSRTDVSQAAIRATGTAACLDDIPPSRIKLLSPIASLSIKM